MKSIIEHIRENVQSGAYRLTFHGFERCVERGISPEEIRSVIFIGEVIEDYPGDIDIRKTNATGTIRELAFLNIHGENCLLHYICGIL